MEEIWHYRVIRKAGRYGVHEVYYDDEGEIWGCSEEPVRLEAESLEDLREDLVDAAADLDELLAAGDAYHA